MPRILVIEDDDAIRQGIIDALGFDGCTTFEAADGPRGLDAALGASYDLLLLDLVLPGGDGFDILHRVREQRPTTPVIILTALGEETDRIKGLKLGADDYVVKPFSVKELLARVEAVLRRSPNRPVDIDTIQLPNGNVDFARREVRMVDGRRAELSERELELLRYLAQNAGRVVPREELLETVWRVNPRNIIETRTIDMAVQRLREKLGDDARHPTLILTVRGKGYKFGGPVDAS